MPLDHITTSRLVTLAGVLIFGTVVSSSIARPTERSPLDAQVRSALDETRRELLTVRFHRGRSIITPFGWKSSEKGEPIIVRFELGSLLTAVRIDYQPERFPARPIAGTPFTKLEVAQSRYYDDIGAVVVKSGRPERLTSDYQLFNWAPKESYTSSPQLIVDHLAYLSDSPDQTFSTDGLEFPAWDVGAKPGDKYVLSLEGKITPLKGTPSADFYSIQPRSIRLSKKYDYRPDLILVMNRPRTIVWERWRLEWAKVKVDGKEIWFPSSVRKEWYNPLEKQDSKVGPRPMVTVDTEVDLKSVSTILPFSLIGPKLPPGAPPRIVMSGARRVTREEMARLMAKQMTPAAGSTAAASPSNPVAALEPTKPALSTGWRTVIVSAVVLAGIVSLRWIILRFRGVRT